MNHPLPFVDKVVVVIHWSNFVVDELMIPFDHTKIYPF